MATIFKLIQEQFTEANKTLNKHMVGRAKKIDNLFNKVANGSYVKGINLEGIDLTQPLDLNKFPSYKAEMDRVLDRFRKSLKLTIEEGNEKEWQLSNAKNDALVDILMQKTSIPKERLQTMKNRNLEALDAFQKRKSAGLNLSERVWKISEQLKGEVELALELGIGEGKSAAQMSRDVRKYLREPDKLFRRVRDEKGVLRLSKAAKNYHPGRGVYRSSYKNAIRLTGTENNMAYRTADHERWNQLKFIIGIEVKLSNNHPILDICDELKGVYPKSFLFIGWHPQCRCFAVPKLAEMNEFVEYQKNLMNGGDGSGFKFTGEVKDVPDNFKAWVKENHTRFENAKNKPYFIAHNERLVKNVLYPQPTRKLRTDDEISAIKDAWSARKEQIKWIDDNKAIALNNGYLPTDIDTSKLNEYLSNKSTPRTLVTDEIKRINKQVSTYEEILKSYSSFIDDPISEAKRYGVLPAVQAFAAIEGKIKDLSVLSFQSQLAKLNIEIPWVEKEKKYVTWEVAKKAYIKYKGVVIDKMYQNEINTYFGEISDYLLTSKSPILKTMYDDAKKMLAEGGSKLTVLDKLKLANKKMLALEKTKARAAAKSTRATKIDIPDAEEFQPLSTDEIEKMLEDFKTQSSMSMDAVLRPQTKEIWNFLSIEEREVLTKYTQTYHYLNEPLRGLTYLGEQELKKAYEHDLKLLTSALNKVQAPQNMVVRRGVHDFKISKDLYFSDIKEGDVFVDKGFFSTSASNKGGFHDSYEMIICIPKGAKGIYAEPFSHYTDEQKFNVLKNNKVLWNGKTDETIRSEKEWIGQRGGKLRVIKREGNTIYFELLGQLQ